MISQEESTFISFKSLAAQDEFHLVFLDDGETHATDTADTLP